MSHNDRRGFLAATAGLGMVALAPGVHLMQVAQAQTKRAAGEPASRLQRWGMLIDTTKCAAGCDACVKACAAENGINETVADPRQASQWIRKIDIKDPKNGRQHSLPMMCQHCAEPPCVDVCPTGASMKRADGIVLVDRHICIGCVESCTLCVHRVDKGLKPACVEACPEQAMLFGDLEDPNSEIARRIASVATAQVRADLKLDTGVRYQGI